MATVIMTSINVKPRGARACECWVIVDSSEMFHIVSECEFITSNVSATDLRRF
ncbi:hypothetical protein D9M69_718660 [compost metagenome]